MKKVVLFFLIIFFFSGLIYEITDKLTQTEYEKCIDKTTETYWRKRFEWCGHFNFGLDCEPDPETLTELQSQREKAVNLCK